MKIKCYYDHPQVTEDMLFTCFDGVSQVCPRCCVEICPSETAKTFADCLASGHTTWKSIRPRTMAQTKFICLESYWKADKIFLNPTVKPFFEALNPLMGGSLRIGHRFVESIQGLKFYTQNPDGILWKDPATFDTPFYYLAFHGTSGGIFSVLDEINSKVLCEAFYNFGEYPNIIYFSSCGVFKGTKGKSFAKKFLKSSENHAILGYTEDVDWIHSMIIDLIFIDKFYYDPNPWKNLKNIYDSIIADNKLASELGFSLFLNPIWYDKEGKLKKQKL